MEDTSDKTTAADSSAEVQIAPTAQKSSKIKSIAQKSTKKYGKKAALGLGASLLLTLVIGLGSIFSFLNVFKLNTITQNIEQKAFARYSGAAERRSTSWMAAYIAVRLGEIENNSIKPEDRKNIFFQADSVNAGGPFKNWYRTMRASSFEKDVFEKSGMKFVTVLTPDGQIRPGVIGLKFNDKKDDARWGAMMDGLDREALKRGDLDALNKFQGRINVTLFENDKAARSELKKLVNDHTHTWQVIKRRHLRKDLQSINGIRDWRFFEGTRGKIDQKKIDMRNKLIQKVFPVDSGAGQLLRCLLGMADCGNVSNDPNSPDAKADAPDPGKGPDTTTDTHKDKDGKIVASKIDSTLVQDIVTKFTEKINPILSAANIVGTLDQYAKIDKNIKSGKMSELVSLARGRQASALYTSLTIASDQIKSGNVNAKEVGKFMEIFNTSSASEGWSSVINPSTATAKAENFQATTNKADYCSTKHQSAIANPTNQRSANGEFAYLCGDKKIGGGSSLAGGLEDMYNSTIGAVIGPIADAWSAVSDSWPLSYAKSLLGSITSVFGDVVMAVVQPILSATGLSDLMSTLIGWVSTQLLSFLGGGPLLKGNEPGGQFFNVALEGASYSAESSARLNGASATTPESQQTAIATDSDYQSQIKKDTSISQKYFALSDPNSLLSQNLFAVLDTPKGNFMAHVSKFFSNAGDIVFSLLSFDTHASQTPYAAAGFSGIQTYDFPQECYDLSPLDEDYSKGTNIVAIFNANGVDSANLNLSWDIVTDSTKWSTLIYGKLGSISDPGKIAKQIYNCHLLDTTTSGGLGAVYGYNGDNGLSSTGQ